MKNINEIIVGIHGIAEHKKPKQKMEKSKHKKCNNLEAKK